MRRSCGTDWSNERRAPMEFVESDDPRIVTGCWIELCIFDDKIVEPEDRLLERPLPYSVPIKGTSPHLLPLRFFLRARS